MCMIFQSENIFYIPLIEVKGTHRGGLIPAQYVSRKLPSTEIFLPFFLFLGEEEVLKSACSLMYLLNVMFLVPKPKKEMHISLTNDLNFSRSPLITSDDKKCKIMLFSFPLLPK